MPDDAPARRDIGRLNAFTDGVMVVSMTLLILNVQLPDNVAGLNDAALLRALADLWPKYFGYVVSFLVIAQYWMGYTEKFGGMRVADSGFAWLNIAFLLSVGFIPFATSLLSSSHGSVATSLYAATMIVVSLLLVAMWLYAAGKGLVQSRLPPEDRWRETAPWLHVAGVFAISILVALYDAGMARIVWLLLLVPIDRWLLPRLAR